MFKVIVDEELIHLIPQFIANRIVDIDSMILAAEDWDFIKIKHINHNIRGIAISYGFVHLESLSRRLSENIENLETIVLILNEMKYYINNVDYSADLDS